MSLPRGVRFVLREIVVPLSLAIVLALTIQATIAKPYEIPTASMDPTILPHDRVLSNRVVYHVRDIRRGDIIVFDPPASLHSAVPFVKRVVGLPRETIEVRGRQVWINDRPLREDYPVFRQDLPDTLLNGLTSRRFGPYPIPAGHYFMMGDNRDNSNDSRFWGRLAESRIRGKAMVIFWPPSRIRVIH